MTKNEQSNKTLESKLWAAAEQLRANSSLKLNEISEPILGLIFLKFADVKFKRAKQQLENERKSNSGTRQAPITPDTYKAKGIVYLPDFATYSFLMNLPESENIGKAINDAMKAIEEENRDLAGVLPQDYTTLSKKSEENSRILITLLKNFNQIPDDIEGDAFGRIYEYFLGQFASSEGQRGGEFFTPQSIVKLLVEIIEPYHGRIYDPAAGSGGMFVQSAHFVEKHLKNKSTVMDEVAVYGQEKGSSNVRIAKMNLAIHGLSGKIMEANSYYEDVFDSVGKFDFVLANPPFNVKGKDNNGQLIIDPSRLQSDPRYYLGLPLTGKNEISNANYLWIQIFSSALNNKGRAGFVMANSAADAGNSDKDIREKLIKSGIVDAIISVGKNMFMNASLSCTLWFFDKQKISTERRNKVLFIDAEDIFTVLDRAHSTWTEEQIQQISGIVKSYRHENGSTGYTNVLGTCYVATIEEIENQNWSLNPGRYVGLRKDYKEHSEFKPLFQDLYEQFCYLTNKAQELEKEIDTNSKRILSDE